MTITTPDNLERNHMTTDITMEQLDAATERVRAEHDDQAPTEPCINGHFECAYTERGACEQEAVAAEVAR